MRILALETSGLSGSVAAMADGNLLAELELEPRQRSAQSLAPGIRRLLEQVGWTPQDVQLVAVTSGPGSFTGLRVGVTTAKVFAYAAGASVLGVSTLEAIALRAPRAVERLATAVDAQRGEVVTQSFRRDGDGRVEPDGDATLTPLDAWLADLPSGTALSGPVFRRHVDRVPTGLSLVDPQFWYPTAGAVAQRAAILHATGRRDDLWTLAPRYFRRSAAEEKADGTEK